MSVSRKYIGAGSALAALTTMTIGGMATAAPVDPDAYTTTATCFFIDDTFGFPITVGDHDRDLTDEDDLAYLRDEYLPPTSWWQDADYPFEAEVTINATPSLSGFEADLTVELPKSFVTAVTGYLTPMNQLAGSITANGEAGVVGEFELDAPVPVAASDASVVLTTAGSDANLTGGFNDIIDEWYNSSADVLPSGDNAFEFELEATSTRYPNGDAMVLNFWCSIDQDDDTPTTSGNGETCSASTSALDPNVSENRSRFYRFASKDRVLTALYAAQNTTGWGDVAILASSADYSDALASAPLADILDAPVLLANADGSLDPQVKSYLATNYNYVIIVSGPGVIPESTKNALNDALVEKWGNIYDGVNTVRIAGVNRYETAATLAVASLWFSTEDPYSGVNFILADGKNFPDALAAGPAAAEVDNGVILLTAGDAGVPSFTSMFLPGHSISFSPATIAWLPSWLPGGIVIDWNNISSFNHQTVTVVGGAAKAAADAGMLGLATEPVEYDDALVGADRYATAVLVAQKYFGSEPLCYTIASGEDFPDAVVAGAWAANADGPLVLTRNAALPAVTKNYLVAAADNGDKFVVFGGTGSVSRAVSEELQETFRW